MFYFFCILWLLKHCFIERIVLRMFLGFWKLMMKKVDFFDVSSTKVRSTKELYLISQIFNSISILIYCKEIISNQEKNKYLFLYQTIKKLQDVFWNSQNRTKHRCFTLLRVFLKKAETLQNLSNLSQYEVFTLCVFFWPTASNKCE